MIFSTFKRLFATSLWYDQSEFFAEKIRLLTNFKMKIIELVLVLLALQKIGETVSNLIKCLGTFKSP